MAGFFTWALVVGLRITGQEEKKSKFLLVALTPLFGLVLGTSAISLGGPMLGAAFFGSETQVEYTVVRFKRGSDRRCGDGVVLENLPFLFDSLCGVRPELGTKLERGQQVVVVGRGTWMGVYVRSSYDVE